MGSTYSINKIKISSIYRSIYVHTIMTLLRIELMMIMLPTRAWRPSTMYVNILIKWMKKLVRIAKFKHIKWVSRISKRSRGPGKAVSISRVRSTFRTDSGYPTYSHSQIWVTHLAYASNSPIKLGWSFSTTTQPLGPIITATKKGIVGLCIFNILIGSLLMTRNCSLVCCITRESSATIIRTYSLETVMVTMHTITWWEARIPTKILRTKDKKQANIKFISSTKTSCLKTTISSVNTNY